jgi:hypothetical protein
LLNQIQIKTKTPSSVSGSKQKEFSLIELSQGNIEDVYAELSAQLMRNTKDKESSKV